MHIKYNEKNNLFINHLSYNDSVNSLGIFLELTITKFNEKPLIIFYNTEFIYYALI